MENEGMQVEKLFKHKVGGFAQNALRYDVDKYWNGESGNKWHRLKILSDAPVCKFGKGEEKEKQTAIMEGQPINVYALRGEILYLLEDLKHYH